MLFQEIYNAALRLICETEDDPIPDYDDRVPYLLGNFLVEQIPLQKKIDRANGSEPIEYPDDLFVDLGSDFPLSEEFIPAAVYYLAAMLVLDENEEISDRLFDRYIDGIASIAMSLPASSHPIRDHYNALR